MGSSLLLSWKIVHDGVMRRSEAAYSEMTSRGTSAMVFVVSRVRDVRIPLLSCYLSKWLLGLRVISVVCRSKKSTVMVAGLESF